MLMELLLYSSLHCTIPCWTQNEQCSTFLLDCPVCLFFVFFLSRSPLPLHCVVSLKWMWGLCAFSCSANVWYSVASSLMTKKMNLWTWPLTTCEPTTCETHNNLYFREEIREFFSIVSHTGVFVKFLPITAWLYGWKCDVMSCCVRDGSTH